MVRTCAVRAQGSSSRSGCLWARASILAQRSHVTPLDRPGRQCCKRGQPTGAVCSEWMIRRATFPLSRPPIPSERRAGYRVQHLTNFDCQRVRERMVNPPARPYSASTCLRGVGTRQAKIMRLRLICVAGSVRRGAESGARENPASFLSGKKRKSECAKDRAPGAPLALGGWGGTLHR